MTITFDPLWTYTVVAILLGLRLIVTDGPPGPFGMQGPQSMFGMFLLLTVPFVWFGWWLS